MTLAAKRFVLPLLAIGLGMAPVLGVDLPNFTFFQQEQDNWCWAASDQMVLTFLNIPNAGGQQCDAANLAYPDGGCFVPGNCCGTNRGACNLPCSSHIKKLITTDVGEGTSISWTRVKNDIIAGRPFIVKWLWPSGGAHLMVGTGFTYDSLVHVTDPMQGVVIYPYFTTFHSSVIYAWYNLHR